jgi:hypothetical protein
LERGREERLDPLASNNSYFYSKLRIKNLAEERVATPSLALGSLSLRDCGRERKSNPLSPSKRRDHLPY